MMLRVGDVAVAPLPGGGFGACQISAIEPDTITLHALDHVAPSPPALDDLRGAGPVRLDHHHWRSIAQNSVFREQEPIPPDFDWIGNLPVPPGVPADCSSFSGWSSPLLQVALQRDWDRLPEAIRTAFHRPLGHGRFRADLGAAPVELDDSLVHADLTSGAIAVPPDGPVDFSFLDRLRRCTGISWSGPDRGLTAALAAHPLITSLAWSAAPETIDLRTTAIRRLEVTGAVRSLRLPAEAHALVVDSGQPFPHNPDQEPFPHNPDQEPFPDDPNQEPFPHDPNQEPYTHDPNQARRMHDPDQVRCTVDARDEGRWLSLTLLRATRAPLGLRQVRTVALRGAGVLSAASLAGLSGAHSLRLHWSGPPGRLDDSEHLTELPGLRLIELSDAYDITAGDLPTPPLLRHLLVYGLRSSTAAALRSRFQGTEVTLALHGVKPDEWLTGNLDNPFRDWADDSEAGGAAACEAYATARSAVDALPPGRTPADVEPILQALVESLNEIEEEFEIVDTLRREEAGEAFHALATRAGVPAGTADAWFDDWRDF